MKTITAVASPTHTSSLSVALRNERAPELHECELIQALLDNDERQRLTHTFGTYTMGTDVTWIWRTSSGGNDGETNQDITLTGNCALTLSNTGAFTGLGFEVRTGASAYTLTVKNATGGTLTTVPASAWAKFVYTGATWMFWVGVAL
jgi:hypothetical protein